ncbi:MAG: FtsX-like permease family protein [bacterium]
MLILKIVFRNLFRNRLRTALTVLGVATAILAFALLRILVGAWYSGVEASSATRLVTRNAVSLIFSLPLSYFERIRQIDGVSKVSYGSWFGGYYIEEKNLFANFAVEPRSYLELYPEFVLSAAGKEAFLRDRRACVAGRKIAEKFGWTVGDVVPLKGTIFPGDWEFVLKGIYRGKDRTTDETQFFFHWDYLNEVVRKTMPRRADQVGFYLVGVARPDLAAEVAADIDKSFRNSIAETLTETEKAFQMGFVAMTGALVTIIQVISMLVVVIILAVVANTMVMTTRERIGEYAVLKCLGFGRRHVSAIIVGESAAVTLAGCALGLAVTVPTARRIGQELSNFFPVFHMEPGTVLWAFGAALAMAVAAGAVPAWRAARLRVAEGIARIA